MSYLLATIELKKMVSAINKNVIEKHILTNDSPNHLFLNTKNTIQMKMDSFSDEFIKEKLKSTPNCNALVFTNLVSTKIQGKEFTYILYKSYHNETENGMVYFQTVNKKTLEPFGELQFSNQEQNIFFKVNTPDFEESSCNALEAKDSTSENKKIVFLIGNMNEERLLYDIERLIVTTLYNTLKHPLLKFNFIISIARFGSSFSPTFDSSLVPVKKATQKLLTGYPNVIFKFEYSEK